MTSAAVHATFEITCATFTGDLEIAGQTVAVTGASGGDVALSLSNALISMYQFATFNVSVASNVVTVTDTEYKALTDFTFDMFASGCTETHTNGAVGVPKNARVWYQFIVDGMVYSVPAFASIVEVQGATGGISYVDAKEVAYLFLKTAMPSYLSTVAVLLPQYQKLIRLKAGVIETVSSTTTYSASEVSNSVTVFNAVFQPTNEEKLVPYVSAPPVKFIYSKPSIKFQITKDCFEWASIALTASRFGVKYSFFDASDTLESLIFDDTGTIASGIYQIGIGTANPNLAPYITNTCTYYTVQIVYYDGSSETGNYSEVLKLHINDACLNEEIHFLTELGGFETIEFEAIQQKETGITGTTIESRKDPASRTDSAIMPQGGRTGIINQSNPTFTVQSGKYRNHSDTTRYFEEFFNSPVHYLRVVRKRSDGDNEYAMRKIVLDREQITLFIDQEFSQYAIKFQYATDSEIQ